MAAVTTMNEPLLEGEDPLTAELAAPALSSPARQQLDAELASLDPKIAEHLKRKYRGELGPKLCEFLDDPDVTDFWKNPHDEFIWVKRLSRGKERSAFRMSNNRALHFIGTIAAAYNAEVSPRNPRFSRSIPFHGARFTAAVRPVSPLGPQWTIRKRPERVKNLADYEIDGQITIPQIARIDQWIHDRRNILIGGDQGAGKSMLASAIIARMVELYPNERFGIIEDNQELLCSADDRFEWITATKTNGDVANVSIQELIFDSLRWGATRLCIGEIREAAASLLEAWTAGYKGGVATIHGVTPHEVMRRFELLLRRDGFPIERDAIASAIHAIITIHPYRGGRIVRDVVDVSIGANGSYNFAR